MRRVRAWRAACNDRLMRVEVTKNRRSRAYVALLLSASMLLASQGRAQQPPTEERTESIEALRSAAESFVRSEVQGTGGIASITATVDERLRLARCSTALHAQLPTGTSLQTRPLVAISCAAPAHWTVYVPVIVERNVSVLVLRHAVEREARLTAEDVNVESRRVTGMGAAFLADPAELRGRTVRRTLAGGTTLTIDMLNPDFVVHTGQQVMLLAGSGPIEVRAMGRALQDAPAGARLQVQNLSSMRVVEGVAESSATVRVAQ